MGNINPERQLNPAMSTAPAQIDVLREQIRRIETGDRIARGVLPFGVTEIDDRLPGGGLALGALHEVAGGANGALDGAAAALFAAGILARTHGQILWCMTRRDLFAPAIALAGLHPDRVIYAEAGSEKAILACFEEGLRHGGLAGVVAEVARLPMTPSRRLQLAAESTGTIGIAIRRWRRQTEAADFGQPTASPTRWRVTALPSSPLPVPGVGRPRWLVELIRARAGECADFEVEGCDEEGRIAIPAKLVHRPAAAGDERERAIA
jgi:protein ImuA